MKNLIYILLFLFIITGLKAQSQGPLLPDSVYNCTTCSGTNWAVNSSTWGHSLFFLAANDFSNLLHFEDFGFSIPVNAVITGIKAKFPGIQLNRPIDSVVQLQFNGSPLGLNMATQTVFDSVREYGDSINLWGATLSPGQINNPGFGIALQIRAVTDMNGVIANPELTVFYTLPSSLIPEENNRQLIYLQQLSTQNWIHLKKPLEFDGLEIYNTSGMKIYSESNIYTIWHEGIPIHTSLSPGVYVIVLSKGNQPLIKQSVSVY